jgi:hypothetical protein
MAREKSPNAPKWRNIEVTPWPRRGVASWRKMFNTNSLCQLRWTTFGEQPLLLSQLCPAILRGIVSRRECLQTSRRGGFHRRAVAKGSEISKMGRIDFRPQRVKSLIPSGVIADLPAQLTLFSPFLRIYSSFISRKLPSAHPEFLRGVNHATHGSGQESQQV